jgi:hypothetical protein
MSACQQDEVDGLEISSPCTVAWESMPGNDRVRRCGRCRQDVFNIAALTRYQARLLIANRQGRLCVRIFRRPDGTVVTADCWSRLRAARKRGIAAWTLMLIAVAWTEVVAMRAGLRALREVRPRDRPPPTSLPQPFDPDQLVNSPPPPEFLQPLDLGSSEYVGARGGGGMGGI